MKLNFEQIKEITCGAVSFAHVDGAVQFFRFTPAQEELYKPYREVTKSDYYSKTFGGSNIRLVFKTNSTRLGLNISVTKATTRSFFDLEVFVNGTCVGTINNHDDKPFPAGNPQFDCPLGDFSGEFCLGEGEKLVELYLPWSVCTLLKGMTLDDGSFVTPVKRSKKMLIFGDSITQGYDVHQYSRHYTTLLAEKLDADPVNKAIGGEIFFPDLSAIADRELKPDLITVAYGTNDWAGRQNAELFVTHVKSFF
ncbi:MAG: SGNH/GDSL hydrolase family protein, partial [Oscillospiraceae bacterium]|nr:SGNH/GDSL hydrolase family protein [Oscillospiraceae bacterium]